MNNLEKRIQQLETRTTAGTTPTRVMFVSNKVLAGYQGETHIAVEHDSDGGERFEERPGPMPAGAPNLEDNPDPSYSHMVTFVRPLTTFQEA
jgi:hypothetical protein